MTQQIGKTPRLIALACAAVLVPQAGLKAELSLNGQKIEGTWLVTVTRINPPPNLPPTFSSLMTFHPGGGIMETSGTGRTNRGPALGTWLRTGDRQFTSTFYFFRFDPGERFAGVTKVIRNFKLSEQLDTFAGVSVQ